MYLKLLRYNGTLEQCSSVRSTYNIQYENLVDNTEKEARALLEFCNLDWSDQCLEFYKNKRNIRTASVTQVR